MQLVNRLSKLLFTAFVLSLFISCSDDDNNGDNVPPMFTRDDYLGTYVCNEQVGPSAPQSYTVVIVAGQNENDLLIRGLANQGTGFVLQGEALTNGFNIPLQMADGLTVIGTAVTGNALSPMELLFDLDDGSGNISTEAELIKQ